MMFVDGSFQYSVKDDNKEKICNDVSPKDACFSKKLVSQFEDLTKDLVLQYSSIVATSVSLGEGICQKDLLYLVSLCYRCFHIMGSSTEMDSFEDVIH